MSAPVLELSGIEKAFFGVKVLRDVGLRVPVGGRLGLVGENGAGKSTLMNILGGNLAADAGLMRFQGADFAPATPRDAEQRGIAFIHQELSLFPNLTVAENLFLTRFPRATGTPFIRRGQLHRRARQLLGEVGLELAPERLVESLSPGERQLVEIAKALRLDPRLILFDEPTTSLTNRERERLFTLISGLRERGIAMIYISHALEDIFRLCDEIVVLRDGAVAGAGLVGDFTPEKLVTLMVGRTLNQLFPERRTRPSSEVLLDVRHLTRNGVVKNISFTLRAGEVLGVAGLMGAGRSELARLLFGLDERDAGEVRLRGELLPRISPRQMIARGVGFLTENRRSEGLCLDGSVADNLALVTLLQHRCGPGGWLSRPTLDAAVQRIREVVLLDSKARATQPVRTLSGGNQQKVVLGKWLLLDPRVLILDEPTRGIDIGAKAEIYRLIQALADRGAGLLVISSEMEELIGLCDRILVMKDGAWVDEMPRGQFDSERMLRAALGSAPLPERPG